MCVAAVIGKSKRRTGKRTHASNRAERAFQIRVGIGIGDDSMNWLCAAHEIHMTVNRLCIKTRFAQPLSNAIKIAMRIRINQSEVCTVFCCI